MLSSYSSDVLLQLLYVLIGSKQQLGQKIIIKHVMILQYKPVKQIEMALLRIRKMSSNGQPNDDGAAASKKAKRAWSRCNGSGLHHRSTDGRKV